MITTLINHWQTHADNKAYFVLALVMIGFYALIKTVSKLPKIAGMKNWPTVNGEIIHSEVIKSPRTGKRRQQSYINDIAYRYTVNGKTFKNKRIFYGSVDSRSDKEYHDDLANGKYKVGKSIKVFYNSEDPKDALLEPNEAVGIQLFWILLISIFFTVMTVALMKYIKLF